MSESSDDPADGSSGALELPSGSGAQPRRGQHQLPPSRVPNVVANVNSHEEQRLRRSLAQLEQQRAGRQAADAGWQRAFAVRQTVRSQKLHQLGFARSLELLPDSLLTNYGDTLIGVAKQPLLLARIAALAQQQKRLKRAAAANGGGIRRSVSLGAASLGDSSGSSDWPPPEFADDESSAPARRLALPAVAAQPIRDGAAAGGRRTPRPMGEQQQQRRVRLPPLLDPRFTQLVGSLEHKSAWKRRYVPPSVRGPGATASEGNSLDELVNSYYSK